MATATYKVGIDFSNDGAFTNAHEDVSTDVRSRPAIEYERGRDQIRMLAPMMAGKCSFDLDNRDKLYSPEYSAGDLYGSLMPGRQVRLQAENDGTTYGLWRGLLDELEVKSERASRSVGITALGMLSALKGKRISTALYESYRTDQCMQVILDQVGWPLSGVPSSSAWGTAQWDTALWAAAGWPAVDRVLGTGKTTLAYWWLEDEDAFDAIATLLTTEGPGAAVTEDEQGRFVFEGRHYRIETSRCTTSQATFSDTATEPCFSGFRYDPGMKDVINICRTEVKVRSLGSLAKVWELGETLTLGGNETRKIKATSSDPFKDAATPVVSTDYTVSAGSVSTVALDRTSGQSCTISITAGVNGATITGLQLRAKALTVTSTTAVESTIDTGTSKIRYGVRELALESRAEIALNDARDLVNAVVSLYQEPRPTVFITVNNGHADRLTQLLSRKISDRITIVEPQTGLNADFFIEQIRGSISEGGKSHSVTFGCEKCPSLNYGLWGSAKWGENIWAY